MCRFLYIWTYFKYMFIHFFKNVPEVWTFFVRTIVLRCLRILGVLNGPPQIPGVNVRVPFRGKEIWRTIVCYWFLWFLQKRKRKVGTKMITSCSIRRVTQLVVGWGGGEFLFIVLLVWLLLVLLTVFIVFDWFYKVFLILEMILGLKKGKEEHSFGCSQTQQVLNWNIRKPYF